MAEMHCSSKAAPNCLDADRNGLRRRTMSSGALSTRHQIVGYFYDSMPPRCTDVFARFDRLLRESLALRNADSLHGRFLVVLGQVAGNGFRRDLCAEETDTQRVHDRVLAHIGDAVQAVLRENIEIRHRVRIKGFAGGGEFDDEPGQRVLIFQFN